MSLRNASLIAVIAGLACAGCGTQPTEVTVTQTTSTTTTTVIPDVTASGISASPAGVALAGATLVTFSLQSPPSGGVPPYTVTWDFGDGTAPGAGETAPHKFEDPGDFTVIATIRDSGDKSTKVSRSMSVNNVSGDWGIDYTRVVPNHGIDLVQTGTAVTAAVNKGPGTAGPGTGSGGVANPRQLSVSVTFADATPAPFTMTFIGELDEKVRTWTGTATGYPGCPCDFVATR